MSHEDNNVACKTTGEEQCLLRQKALSQFLVPQLVSQNRHPAKNSLSHFLPMFPNLFEVLKPIRCNLPLISQTVFYMSHHLVSFFLRFIFFPSNKVHTHIFCICLYIRSNRIRLEEHLSALSTDIHLNHLQKKVSHCGTVRRWWIYCIIPLPYPWYLICEPRLSESSCWMYPNPVKRKTTPPSQEWHHAPLPNHKSGSSLLVIRGPQNFPLGYNK